MLLKLFFISVLAHHTKTTMIFLTRTIIVAVIFVHSTISAYSQKLEELVIEVDSITKLTTKTIPFDRKFILKVRTDTRPQFIDYIKHKGNRAWNTSIHYYTAKGKTFTFRSIPEENFEIRTEKGLNYLFISFDKHPYKSDPDEKQNDFLQPSSTYSVIIPKFYEKSMQIFEYFYKDDTTKAIKLYMEYDSAHISNYGFTYLIPNIDTVKVIAKTQLNKIFSSIDSLRILENTYENDFSIISRLNQNALIQLGISSIFGIDTTETIFNKSYDLTSKIKVLQEFYNSPDSNNKKIINGRLSLTNLKAEPKKNPTEKEKLTTISSSLVELNQIKNLLEILILENRLQDTGNNLLHVKNLIIQLSKQQLILTQISKAYNDIKEKISEKGYFFEPEVLSGGTIIYDFKTRSKLQLTPDFGYVAYGFQDGFTSFTPYLGFQINFRPVDKNIPLKNYPNKTIWHRLSFMTGWTLSKIAEQNKREDFFSNSSLLTGIAFKLTNAIRMSAGSLWFYKNDPNPLKDSRKISCTIYSGLSIDLDIKELLNDFTSLRPNLK